ncbi:uncharacterized protein PAC_04648 [Phialocephala subalpina]|uniref:2EXR domain-containing protein n=1 Tax=Phialocephala subalpina TaxID=576137 RepID=A0A1L7WPR6_9HELO|nr:uncharacterized protein PAC_04648 [Phialocephala subalpina]
MSQSVSQPPSSTSQLKFEDLHLGAGCQLPSHIQPSQEDEEQTQTFHYFTHLPTELRLRIYALCLPPPRLVPIHYLSPTSFSPSPPSSPSRPSSTFPQRKRIRCSSTTTSPPHTTPKREQIGLTSPATIKALFHLCQESRAVATRYYALSFRLAGSVESKIWFSTLGGGRQQDILYFPSLSHTGYLASFKHWAKTLSVTSASTFNHIRQLAVHEDLFLEERKRRSSQDSGLGWEGAGGWGNLTWGNVEDWERGQGGGDGDGGIWGNGGMAGNGFREGWRDSREDRIVEDRLKDFWRGVRRRFRGLEEVWIVGEGREEDILALSQTSSLFVPSTGQSSDVAKTSFGEGKQGGQDMLSSINSSINLLVCRNRNFKGRETFEEKVARVVCEVVLESRNTWMAPRWRVLGERGGRVASSY